MYLRAASVKRPAARSSDVLGHLLHLLHVVRLALEVGMVREEVDKADERVLEVDLALSWVQTWKVRHGSLDEYPRNARVAIRCARF
mgnify:FL=1